METLTKQATYVLPVLDDAGSVTNMEEVLLSNTKLVFVVTNAFARNNPSAREDFEQAGHVGLLKAARSYKPDQGKWSSWVVQHVRTEVRGALVVTEYGQYGGSASRYNGRTKLLRILKANAPMTTEQLAEKAGFSLAYTDSLMTVQECAVQDTELVEAMSPTTTGDLTSEFDQVSLEAAISAAETPLEFATRVLMYQSLHPGAVYESSEIAEFLGVRRQHITMT